MQICWCSSYVLAVNCLFNYFLEFSVLCVHTLEKRKTFNFDLFFECRRLFQKQANTYKTYSKPINIPTLSYYYKLNQKCLYSEDLCQGEILKNCDFRGIWNMIQIFPKIYHTVNQIFTLKFIVGKNKFIPYIHQVIIFRYFCLPVCVCNYSNSDWK